MNDQPPYPPSVSPPREHEHVASSSTASLDAIIALADQLAKTAPEQRGATIAALPENLAGWAAFFRMACDETGGADPDAAALLAQAEANGLGREASRQLVAALIKLDTLRRHWAAWAQHIDRDELRLRLEILARSDDWYEDFAPFVTFFFRASVADLYQHAAIALGRHLHHSAKLREYLASFAEQRNLALDHPVELGGERSARRLMIALAAARAHPPAELSLTREPVPMEADDSGRRRIALPKPAAELATTLLALEVMVTAQPDDEPLLAIAREALSRIADRDTAAMSRAVVQRFGELLARCGGEQTEANWSRLFRAQGEELRKLEHGRFGRRVAALFRLDELLHAASVLPESWSSRIVQRLAELPSRAERRFAAARVLMWTLRESRSLPGWAEPLLQQLDDDEAVRGSDGPARLSADAMLSQLARLVRAKARRSQPLFAGRPSSAEVDALDRFLFELETPAAWLSHDEPERAVMAMIMLDLAQHMRARAEQTAAVLERHGLIAEAGADGAAGSARAAVTSVILRLLTWENPGAEELIDVRMLHRIDDVRVLLALIPVSRRSPLLMTLADAIEHQLRWRMRRDAGFSPDVLLALTQVRKPHPQLYQSLQALCEGRTYRRADGGEVEILALIRHVHNETESSDGDAIVSESPWDSPYARSLHRLRERLQVARQRHDDVRSRIETLFNAIGESTSATGARPGTVIGVLQMLHDPERPLLQDGFPAWSARSLRQYLREIEPDLLRIKTLAHALIPNQWSDSDDVREAAAGLRSLLGLRLGEMARMLPGPEAAALRDLHDQLQAELVAWSESVESVLDQWPESELRSDTGVHFEAALRAHEAIGRIANPLLRGHLLSVFWQSLRLWSTAPAATDTDRWTMQRDLLDQAMQQPMNKAEHRGADQSQHHDGAAHWSEDDRRRAQAALIAMWIELAELAMDRNEERRVVEMATAERYAPLRRQPAAAETLRAVRKWCHDRYLLRTAAAAQHDLRAGRGRGGPDRRGGTAREIGPFLANFPTIWLAMLIGAIFMLDFGDAWSAMADPDVADIRGITITFLIGIGGAFGYVLWNLKQKSRLSPDEPAASLHRSQLLRAGAFSAVCLVYTLLLVSGLWWLLSETDEVVEGIWAIGHIIVWSGFAMFVGVFFGLLAGDA